MGYMRHHAIVVSASYGDHLEQAYAQAERLGMAVSPIVGSPMNVLRTFFVAPDGSKEGWAVSNAGDQSREEFKTWLTQQRYEDGSGPLAWAEVQYGDDEGETLITAHSDEASRRVPGELV